MIKEEQINNWLTSGMTKMPGSLTESFYYDKLNNEFFSILAIDYFIVDENFNISKDVAVSYSEKNVELLLSRMKRIDWESDDIISIPLADPEIDLQTQIDSFLNLNGINISNATIWLPEDTSITVQLNDEKEKPITNPWWKFR